MPFRTPSYLTICIVAGVVIAALYEMISPGTTSFLDVFFLVGSGALIGNSLGETPPADRPRIHRGALAGIGVGAASSIVMRRDPAATFVLVTLCLLGGTMVARFRREAMLYMLTAAAAGGLGGLAWGLFKDLPLLTTAGQGGLLLTLLAVISLSLRPLLAGKPMSDTDKTRVLDAADRYAEEIRQSQLTPLERIHLINAQRQSGGLQHTRGEDSSEEP